MGVDAPAQLRGDGRRVAAAPRRADAALDTLVDEALRARPELAAKLAQLRAQEPTNKATAAATVRRCRRRPALTYNGREIDNLVWNFSGGLTLGVADLRGAGDALGRA